MNFHRLYALMGFFKGGSGSNAPTLLSLDWEQGMLTAEGWEVEHAERIRTTKCLPDGVTRIVTHKDYDVVAVFQATNAPGVGLYYNPNTKQLTTDIFWMQEIDLTGVSFPDYPKIRLFAKRVDFAALNPGEGANIQVYAKPKNVTTYNVAWESGVIGGYGDLVANAARLRTTDYLPDRATKVTCAPGYQACVVFLNSEHGANNDCYYNPSNGTKGSSPTWSTTVDISGVSFEGYPNKKVVVRREDGANIDLSEASNITITSG